VEEEEEVDEDIVVAEDEDSLSLEHGN